MKIIIDSAIPFIEGVFEPFAKVEYLSSKDITPQKVKDASAMIIRTRTQCSKALLEGSALRHIATATIGFDHIDTAYCQSRNIEVSSAAGCNARGVLQWVSAALSTLSKSQGWQPSDKTIGVVGVGNVGSLVTQYAKLWGFKVLCCDPPRAKREGGDFVEMSQIIASADIITLHTPLNESTHHLIDATALEQMKQGAMIINSSRGEVVDTESLLNTSTPFIFDVWENEPRISSQALQRAILATPHIAGYSLQGKANATTIAVRNVAKALGLPLEEWRSDTPQVAPQQISWQALCQSITQHFDIEAQSEEFKTNIALFEQLRNNYNYREEYF